MRRAALILIYSAVILRAAPVGAIAGQVKDQSGASVSVAEVTLSNPATGARRVQLSGPRGDFEFLLLVPGEWTVSAKAPKFQTVEVPRVQVLVDQTTRVDL